MVEVDEETVRGIVETLREYTDKLESLIQSSIVLSADPGEGSRSNVFDPLTDTPPVSPKKDNQQVGYESPDQIDWCGFLLWGGLYAINAREGRYATEAECRAVAKKAGYHGNAAWTGTGNWKLGTEVDAQRGRMISEHGIRNLIYYMEKLGLTLPADLPDPGAYRKSPR